mmetsp:Transcript_786/g.796  ORF Transcript_786/g.796 Transcript_786/m.796 type:complete len:245 (-) Transcript_786:46-780(-)
MALQLGWRAAERRLVAAARKPELALPAALPARATASSGPGLWPRRHFASLDSSKYEAAVKGLPGGPKQLSDVAKVPMLKKESPVKVRDIWLERFRDKENTVAGVLTDEEYTALTASAAACPMFLVPIPRGDGYINLVWQAQGNRFVYQSIEAFRSGGAHGHVDLGVALFPELMQSHKLVLLHGEITGGLSKAEAACIVRYTREAYADPARFAWVKRFNFNARDFDYEEFLREFRPLERFHAAGA